MDLDSYVCTKICRRLAEVPETEIDEKFRWDVRSEMTLQLFFKIRDNTLAKRFMKAKLASGEWDIE